MVAICPFLAGEHEEPEPIWDDWVGTGEGTSRRHGGQSRQRRKRYVPFEPPPNTKHPREQWAVLTVKKRKPESVRCRSPPVLAT